MLDINLFRDEPDSDHDIIRESIRRRFKPVSIVDEIINLDRNFCQLESDLGTLRRVLNITDLGTLRRVLNITEEVKELEISGKDATEKIKSIDAGKLLVAKKEIEVQKAKTELDAKLAKVGNLVHHSVPVSNNEDDNETIRTWGERREEPKLKNHVELVRRLEIVDLKKGANVAGSRGFYLKGDGVFLNLALIKFGLEFLAERNYTPMQTPFFMRQDIMAKCAQSAQYNDELYKVTGEGDDKYLIATAEQPLCAYHLDDWLQPSELPLRYAGYSTCFRKEAGSDDCRGHQFEEVEQFCITSPNHESWTIFEEMIKNSEDFYKKLNIPYRVVAIVSGALNDAAVKKYDLEGWYPASKTYKELVSCSNCTDYQARSLETRYGHATKKKQYVHLLSSTLTATDRTICCILENYQKKDGVEIPKALRTYMRGLEFLPFHDTKGDEDEDDDDEEDFGH